MKRSQGSCISRYMIIELGCGDPRVCDVSLGLAKRVASGQAPKGKRWNLLEGMVQWVRSDVAVPAMGEHDADKFMPLVVDIFLFHPRLQFDGDDPLGWFSDGIMGDNVGFGFDCLRGGSRDGGQNVWPSRILEKHMS